MDGDGLEVGRWRDELKDIIDLVPFDVGGIHCGRRVDWVLFHSGEGEFIRSETSECRGIVAVNTVGGQGERGRNCDPFGSDSDFPLNS